MPKTFITPDQLHQCSNNLRYYSKQIVELYHQALKEVEAFNTPFAGANDFYDSFMERAKHSSVEQFAELINDCANMSETSAKYLEEQTNVVPNEILDAFK